jgi:hypothetical protein
MLRIFVSPTYQQRTADQNKEELGQLRGRQNPLF